MTTASSYTNTIYGPTTLRSYFVISIYDRHCHILQCKGANSFYYAFVIKPVI